MLRNPRPWIAVALGSVFFTSCIKDYLKPENYRLSPAWAIPVANGNMTMADILKANEGEVQYTDTVSSGDDVAYGFKIVYSDTLEPITLGDLGSGGFIPPGASITMPEQSTFLRMFGELDNGSFLLTDPTIVFRFINHMECDFEFDLLNTKTVSRDGNETYPFSITTTPFDIAAATAGSTTTSAFTIDNGSVNPNDALTQVFEPTPKYMYYTPRLSAPTGAASITGDKIELISEVHLPFQGRGEITFSDTLFYNLSNLDSLSGLTDGVEYLTLRMSFTNTLPIGAQIVYGAILHRDENDSNAAPKFVANLPFYEPGTSDVIEQPFIVAPGDPAANADLYPVSPVTTQFDITLYNENPNTGESDVETLISGNMVIISARIASADFDENFDVKIYSDQSLQTTLALRTRLDVSANMLIDATK